DWIPHVCSSDLLGDLQADTARETLALNADHVGDDPVAIAPTPARTLAQLRRHPGRHIVEVGPARLKQRELAPELSRAHRVRLERARRERNAPEVGGTGSDTILDHRQPTRSVER